MYCKEECVTLDVKKLLFFALFVGMNRKNRGKRKKRGVWGGEERAKKNLLPRSLCHDEEIGFYTMQPLASCYGACTFLM